MGAQAGESPYRIAQGIARAGWRWRELDCANSSDVQARLNKGRLAGFA